MNNDLLKEQLDLFVEYFRVAVPGMATLDRSPATSYADSRLREDGNAFGIAEHLILTGEGSPYWELHMKE